MSFRSKGRGHEFSVIFFLSISYELYYWIDVCFERERYCCNGPEFLHFYFFLMQKDSGFIKRNAF